MSEENVTLSQIWKEIRDAERDLFMFVEENTEGFLDDFSYHPGVTVDKAKKMYFRAVDLAAGLEKLWKYLEDKENGGSGCA